MPDGRGRLRVLVDAANLKPGQTGIRTYTLSLIRALALRDDLSITVVTSLPEAFTGMGLADVVAIDPATRSFVRRTAWREANLPRLTRATRADVVVVNTIEAPVRRLAAPGVIVLHDIGPLVAPALYGPSRWIRFVADLPRALRWADHVLSVSRTTLFDANLCLGLPAGKTTVIGSGARTDPELRDRDRRPDTDDPFVFYSGTLYGNKNVAGLIRAFGPEHGDLPRLVLTGPATPRQRAQVASWIREARAEHRVEHRGYVSTAELRRLYETAIAYVFPTLYEGFGMPVLEAMGFGTPVVGADIPSLREAGGDAFLRVADPLSPASWAEAIRRVAGDEELCRDLVARGHDRAAGFDWADVASRCAGALWSVARRGGPVGGGLPAAPADRIALR